MAATVLSTIVEIYKGYLRWMTFCSGFPSTIVEIYKGYLSVPNVRMSILSTIVEIYKGYLREQVAEYDR